MARQAASKDRIRKDPDESLHGSHADRGAVAFVMALLLLGLLVRLPLLAQSLWYDEIVTLAHYIMQPWGQIVSGTYSPNNHILFSLVAKGAHELTGGDMPALAARLPSALAGAAVAIILAWSLRRQHPRPAILLAALITLNPWLVSFSGWARGYAMLLFLAAVATHFLAKRSMIPYAIAVVAMLYTHPLGIAVVIGHAAAVAVMEISATKPPGAPFSLWKRDAARWLLAVGAAGAASALLYLPFLAGGRGYWAEQQRASIAYGHFLAESLRHAHAGQSLGGLASIIVGAFACTIGSALAWRWGSLRPAIVTFAVASAFALAAPLAIPAAGEARAALWLIPLYGIGMTGILASIPWPSRWRWASIAGGTLLAAYLAVRICGIIQTPAQPICDAIDAARDTALRNNERIIGIYMASQEARAVYGGIDFIAYKLDPKDRGDVPSLKEAEASAGPGKRPVAIVFYEDFLQRDRPELWRYVRENYEPIERLPGRIAPATVYRRK